MEQVIVSGLDQFPIIRRSGSMTWEAWSELVAAMMNADRTARLSVEFSDVEMKAALVIVRKAPPGATDDDLANQLELEGADHRAKVMLIRMAKAALLAATAKLGCEPVNTERGD